jgi:hypothetical protein
LEGRWLEANRRRDVAGQKGYTMSDGEFKYPKWQAQFEEAIVELDCEKLVGKNTAF